MHTFLKANPAVAAIVAATITFSVMTASYFIFEPVVAYGITDTFTIEQEVTSEISFKTLANDVVMTPDLAGITGGTAYGTSTVAITTNNPTGYVMSISFATLTAMQGENLNSDIDNYTPSVGGTPDFTFAVGANDAEFAYSVYSDTTPDDASQLFTNDGGACNTGTAETLYRCWYGAADATSLVQLIDRPNATPGTGATSTILFRVGITSNPSPAIETGFYNATATLTAVTD